MTRFVKSCILVLLLSTRLVPARAETPKQEYWVRVPATARSCEEEAEALARRFEAATGQAVKSRECLDVVTARFDDRAYVLYSLLLTYEARVPLPLYRARLGASFGFGGRDSGAYGSYEQCLADLSAQAALFERAAGLSALAGECAPSPAYGQGYLLSIEGPGVPARKLQGFNPLYEDAVLQSEIEGLLVARGAQVARSTPGAILYYSGEALNLRQEYHGYFRDRSQCELQEPELRKILAVAGGTDAIIHCAGAGPGSPTTLFGLAVASRWINRITSAVTYYSFDECMKDRARVSKGYAGSLCAEDSITSGRFSMTFYDVR
ncbi:MAG: hypothetical protein NDJ89_15425 [Oligoflexia bacterium]|nr:hypothetical protein [Oligoflexia bacterium]